MSEEKNKDDINNNLPELPLLAQVALSGEVSSQYLNSYSDEDALVRTYLMLRCTSKDKFSYYLEECRKHMEDESIDKCLMYISTNIFPVTFFTNRFMQDIRICFEKILGECDSKYSLIPPMTMSTLQSKFAFFISDFALISPKLTVDLLDNVLINEEENFECLKEIAFVMKNSIVVHEEEDLNEINLIALVKLLQDSMITTNLLSFNEELSAVQNNKSNNTSSKEDTDTDKVYIVNKIDKSSGKVIFPKEFKTHSEASQFIHSIKNDYPELFKRYDFIIKIETKKGESN